ncbi:MAG: hypothetical protein M3Z01_06455 [Thermoproteota archaeon]|nr:hypothetical protein [Thermoproteota archaeon]
MIFSTIVIACAAMAFQDSSKIDNSTRHTKLDTLPKNNSIISEPDWKEMNENIQKSLELTKKSLQDIDWNKISTEVNRSLKAIDMEKIRNEVAMALKGIDMNSINIEIQKEMKNINMEEMKKDLEQLKKINLDELKKEMERLKKEMELNKDQIKIEMDKAKSELRNVKTEVIAFKEMKSEMEKDGLLNKDEHNSIEYKNNDLLINGKKQLPDVTEKYRKYFNKNSYKYNF